MHAAAALYKPNDAVGSALAPLTLMGPLLVGVAALVAVTVGVLVRVRRTTATWDCGYAQPTPRMQYTASSFAQQLVELFRWALLPVSHRPRIVSLFPEPDRFESHVPDPVLDRVLLPGIHGTGRMMSFARIIQAGRLQTYLIYVGCALVVLLTWSAL